MKSLDRITSKASSGEDVELINELSVYTCFSTWKNFVGWNYDEPINPDQFNENFWIPVSYAALLAGISKQALSDRIRRGTLECRERQQKSFWEGDGKGVHIKLVRWGDVTKKRKAGRPKGSRNKDAETKREPQPLEKQTDIANIPNEGIECKGSKTCTDETCQSCHHWIGNETYCSIHKYRCSTKHWCNKFQNVYE